MTHFDPTGEGLPFGKRELWAELSDAARARVVARFLFETTGKVATADVRAMLRQIDPQGCVRMPRRRAQEAVRGVYRRARQGVRENSA